MEEHGPLRLFVADGAPWPYYARPSGAGPVRAADVTAMRARQRELGLPESFEWVHDLAPELLEAARGAGLAVHEAPLLVLDPARRAPAAAPPGVRVRVLEPDDRALAAARATADVGFAAPGTAPANPGTAERDAAAAALGEEQLAPLRVRMRARRTITAVAEEPGRGVLAAGSHQPVGGVTEIVGVATLPAERRRGFAAAVTAALVEDALAHGDGTVFLSADDDAVARIYERLGFVRAGTACIAAPAAA